MSEEKLNNSNDSPLILCAIIFVLGVVGKKLHDVRPYFVDWLERHRFTVATTAGLFGITLSILGYAVFQVLNENRLRNKYLNSVTEQAVNSVYAGRTTGTDEEIYIPIEARRMHTQVIGTTNAGKTESVIIPWAVSDIQDKRGFVIVDGKADQSFITKIYGYVKFFDRSPAFKLFSLQNPNHSHTFNPLLGGTPEEVAERVFNSFEFENPYYKAVQYEVFSQVLRIFDSAKLKPTFLRVYEAIKNPEALYSLAVDGKDASLEGWASGFRSISPSDRDDRTSGLLAALSHFAFGSHAKLFNTDEPDIDLDRVIRGSEMVYFQLPVLKAAFLGKATGKLVLQCLQSAVANRHQTGNKEHPFFSVYLDDFTEYLYPGFVSLLNKSRSANVGVVFAHQSLGDIKALGEEVATSILTNSNLKVIMRGNDPDSAEYFAKVIGTKESEKVTERAESSVFGRSRTGQGSLREVEEFIVHPNVIKRNMGVGEALVIVPHHLGSKVVRLKFQMVPALLQTEEMPKPQERPVLGLVITPTQNPQEKSQTTQILSSQTQKEAA